MNTNEDQQTDSETKPYRVKLVFRSTIYDDVDAVDEEAAIKIATDRVRSHEISLHAEFYDAEAEDLSD